MIGCIISITNFLHFRNCKPFGVGFDQLRLERERCWQKNSEIAVIQNDSLQTSDGAYAQGMFSF